MGGENAFMDFYFYFFLQETPAINLTTFMLTTGGRERLFHLSIIPRGKKSEDTDHLTPPTEAAPVGQPRSTGGLDPDQLFLRPLSRAATGQPLVSSHRQARRQRSRQIYVQISQEVTVRCLTWLWLSMSSPHQYYSKFLVLNKCYRFLKSLPRPRFCEGTGEGATWPKVKQDHWARIEGRKTQFMKPV